MTFKNNRAPLLWHFKPCASFHSHWSIQAGVTVRKRPNWGKICLDVCDLDLWPLTLTFCMDITFVNDNNSWKFHDDLMGGTLWKSVKDEETDGRTECTPRDDLVHLSVHKMWTLWKPQMILTRCTPHASNKPTYIGLCSPHGHPGKTICQSDCLTDKQTYSQGWPCGLTYKAHIINV